MKLKTFTFLSTLTVCSTAIADDSKFKYIVISDDAAAIGLDTNKAYEDHLTDCLAFAKESAHYKAEAACSDAIKSAKRDFALKSSEAKAYAYNNRAIVRAMANNKVGALDDLRKAASYKKLEVIKNNLTKLTDQINQVQQL